MRSAGTPVAAPQVSVMPQTSSIGTPSARYHLTSSGEIGAAPVTRKRDAVDADQLAHVVQHQPARQHELQLEEAADRLAGHHLVGDLRADADAPRRRPPAAARLASLSAIITPE